MLNHTEDNEMWEVKFLTFEFDLYLYNLYI